jgi:hypothetical protein
MPGAWEKDAEALSCKICCKEFNLARRKHHCRYQCCGSRKSFCSPLALPHIMSEISNGTQTKLLFDVYKGRPNQTYFCIFLAC